METPRSPKGQDVVAIVRHICQTRARQRLIPLRRRHISVKKVKGDFKINKYEIFIDWVYATTGNPIKMIDRVLDGVVDFDRREFEDRVRRITEVKSLVMKWAAFLERTLSEKEYREFVESLLPSSSMPGPGPIYPIEMLAPDPVDLDLAALVAEGEHFIYKGIHLRV